ncbi:lysophosphatidylcholine acyltransferase 1 isoform X2 [Chelonia mydas]|uniref:lysophosphatidylcholine acyltransferase 1 isoform X2 n=1 Tax=Chelonia mydas TaxID=8469 RepID=UPI0018A1BA25|nr:lysophosphatidylcholine acyltransferase 1 isoform X2 [Chelonia mydas]
MRGSPGGRGRRAAALVRSGSRILLLPPPPPPGSGLRSIVHRAPRSAAPPPGPARSSCAPYPAMRLSSRGRGCCAAGGRERGPPPPPPRSPFVHQLRPSALQKAKIAFMTLTLFPIRLFFAAFMMLLAWPFAFIASMGSAERELERPLSWWRKVVDFLLKAIMRTMWFAGGFHWINVKGRQALPAEAAILTLAPHSSYFDAIPVTMTMASIVMKAESKDIPVWGTLIKYIRPVFVSRSDQDSRRKTVEEIKRRAQSDGKWPQIMIFPEGTCTNRSCLITFKPGAFIPGVPVQPVVLRYPNKLDTITWTWQGPGALEILWLTLCQFHNFVEIEFLPVYIPSEEEKKNPSLYANNVRSVMAEALGVSVTDYTFEDCQLALAEGQLRLPSNTCLLEFAKLVRSLGLKPEKLEKDLDRYSESAKKKKEKRVSLKEFAAYLEVPISDTLENMFALFVENEDGVIDLREYVTALSVVCRPSKTLETIQLAFKMYESQNGTIIENNLACILKTALGVSELNVTDLFKAIDAEEKGKITYAPDWFLNFEWTSHQTEVVEYTEMKKLLSLQRRLLLPKVDSTLQQTLVLSA